MAKYKLTNVINGMIIGITDKPIRNNDIVELNQNQLKQVLYSANIKQVLSTGEEVGINLENYTTDFESIVESKSVEEVTPISLDDNFSIKDDDVVEPINEEEEETEESKEEVTSKQEETTETEEDKKEVTVEQENAETEESVEDKKENPVNKNKKYKKR